MTSFDWPISDRPPCMIITVVAPRQSRVRNTPRVFYTHCTSLFSSLPSLSPSTTISSPTLLPLSQSLFLPVFDTATTLMATQITPSKQVSCQRHIYNRSHSGFMLTHLPRRLLLFSTISRWVTRQQRNSASSRSGKRMYWPTLLPSTT